MYKTLFKIVNSKLLSQPICEFPVHFCILSQIRNKKTVLSIDCID